MAVGAQIYNDSGVIQIDDQYTNLCLRQTGTATVVNRHPASLNSHAYIAMTVDITYVGQAASSPIIAMHGTGTGGAFGVIATSRSGNTWTFRVIGYQHLPTFNYFIYDIPSATGSGAGFEVYKADGSIAFSSFYRPLSVVGVMQSEGIGINLTQGRQYAVAFNSEIALEVFEDHHTNGSIWSYYTYQLIAAGVFNNANANGKYEAIILSNAIAGGVYEGAVNIPPPSGDLGSWGSASTGIIIDVTDDGATTPVDPSFGVSVNATSRTVTGTGSGTTTNTTITASTNGGTAPFSYQWDKTGGDTQVVASGSSTAAAFRTQVVNQTSGTDYTSTWICMVKDAAGRTAYSPQVTFRHIQPWQNLNPNAVDWPNISGTAATGGATTAGASRTISGITGPINIRATISNFTGTNVAATSSIDTYVAGARRGGSSGLGNGNWSAGDASNNQAVHFVAILNPANTALQASASYTVTITNQTTGATLDTFTVNQTANTSPPAPDKPDPISFPPINIVSNTPTPTALGTPFQIRGISQAINMRFERYNPSIPTGSTLTLKLQRATSESGPWTNLGNFTDFSGIHGRDVTGVTNGTWFRIDATATTESGKKTVKFDLAVWNLTRNEQLIRVNNNTIVADNDNNHNILEPTPSLVFPNQSWSTTNPSTSGAYSSNGPTVAGLSAGIRLRFEVISVTNNLSTSSWTVTNIQGSTHTNYLTNRTMNVGSSGEFDVSNGSNLTFKMNASTTSGRRSANGTIRVTNVTTGTILGTFTFSVTVDSNDVHNKNNPNPVDWANLSLVTNDPTGTTSGSFKQITGITVPITIRVQVSGFSGNLSTWRQNVHYNPSGSTSSGGPWTNTSVTGNGYVDFTITNNQWIYFDSYATTSSGKRQGSWTTTVTNLTTGQVLDTFTSNITVDNDNNHNINQPLAVSISPTWLEAPWEFVSQGQFWSQYVGRTNITITGGVAPYTHAWERLSGLSGFTVSSYTTYADFNYSGRTNYNAMATYRLKITDSLGAVAYSQDIYLAASAGNILN